MDFIRYQENTMFLAKVCYHGQFFLSPDTTTWIMWTTEDIEFNIIIYDITFQLLKINFKMPVNLNKTILNQLAIIQANRTSKRWINWCVDKDSIVFFGKRLNSC